MVVLSPTESEIGVDSECVLIRLIITDTRTSQHAYNTNYFGCIANNSNYSIFNNNNNNDNYYRNNHHIIIVICFLKTII